MLERAWDRAASLTGVSRATAQRIITKKVELLSSLIAGPRDEMPEPVVITLIENNEETDTADGRHELLKIKHIKLGR